jgi:hypothetical protein
MQFNDVSFIAVGLGPMGSPLTLHLAVLTLPIFYLITKRISDVKGINQTFIFFGITILSGIGFWLLRLYYLKGITENYRISTAIENTISISKLKFELFCWLGFLVGAILSILLFKYLNKIDAGNNANTSPHEILDK